MKFKVLFFVSLASLILTKNSYCVDLTLREFKQRYGDRFRSDAICITYRPPNINNLPYSQFGIKCDCGSDSVFVNAQFSKTFDLQYLLFENIEGRRINELFGEYDFFYDPSKKSYYLKNTSSGIHAVLMNPGREVKYSYYLSSGNSVFGTSRHRVERTYQEPDKEITFSEPLQPIIIASSKPLKKKKLR